MKIYQVDACTWYAANSPEEATQSYVRDIGTDETVVEFGAAEEVPEAEYDQKTIVEIDEPGHPSHTFREALSQMAEPGFVATTEY